MENVARLEIYLKKIPRVGVGKVNTKENPTKMLANISFEDDMNYDPIREKEIKRNGKHVMHLPTALSHFSEGAFNITSWYYFEVTDENITCM